MDRRGFLTAGVAAIATTAGCSGAETDYDDSTTGTSTATDESSDGQQSTDDSSNNETTDTSDTTDSNGDETTNEPQYSDADTLLHIRETLGDTEPMFDPTATSFSGSGEEVTGQFDLDSSLAIFAFEHDGSSNFQVEAAGENEALLVNEIGAITGAMATPASAGEYRLDVTADGNWQIDIGQPIAPMEEWRRPGVSASGDSQSVVGPVEIDGTVVVTGTHSGDSNFQVTFYDEGAFTTYDGKLVFNEIGEFEGETLVDLSGLYWIDVMANGQWSLDIQQ